MEEKSIVISRGTVFGAGKFKLEKSDVNGFEIPQFSFILTKDTASGLYVATCIHLSIDGYGETIDKALIEMIDFSRNTINEAFTNPRCKDKAWESLEEWFECNEVTIPLWNAYHQVQIELAKQGRSIDNVNVIIRELELLRSRVDRLESDEARQIKYKILEYSQKLNLSFAFVKKEAA